MTSASLVSSAIQMNSPGRYLHWSIFTVSVANLALIAVMVVIFGAALLLPFPRSKGVDLTSATAAEPQQAGDGSSPAPDGSSRGPAGSSTAPAGSSTAPAGSSTAPAGPLPGSDMWTARVRRMGLRYLPPNKLLPDRQPAYVASWIYVFGVGALAALGFAIVSGFAIAIGGTDWWHSNPVGHFFNSLHLWSVELFMALLVIHLWGKFWMAAWRGRRGLTWVTGVVAFAASILECFTGYLSQQNFDSQWISTNAKDATNSAGVGAFFNVMNFGQMLLWHVVLIPIVLVALVGAHILLVRVRGVSHPLPVKRQTLSERRAARAAERQEWRGPTRRYDILKEGVTAVAIVSVLVVALAGLLSSPDEPPVTVQTWARLAPADFLGAAASELSGTSETAQYGQPYNTGTNNVQRLGFSPQVLAGVRQPIDAAQTFVISPLSKLAPTDPPLSAALAQYVGASSAQQGSWNDAYGKAIDKVTFQGGNPVLPPGSYGPIPAMLNAELTLARSGALDADLLAQRPFYGTNFTKPLLFLEDGSYYSGLAEEQHLTGSQWGVMNETGSYPGQPWLWLYTLWYQVRPFKNSANVDLMAIYLTGAATLLLLAVPWLPGVRDIPRLIPVHRLVWRDWNRTQGGAAGTGGGPSRVGGPLTDREEESVWS